jgi:hypothetical protein
MKAGVWVHQEKTEVGVSAISSTQTKFEATVSKQVGDLVTENQETQLDIQKCGHPSISRIRASIKNSS